MTIDELLMEISGRAIELRRSGDDLILRGHEKVMDASMVNALRMHKAALLRLIGSDKGAWWTPPIVIKPEMLTLVNLSQEEIGKVVTEVSGGAKNVQDIYPLAPLQEGILFHYLIHEEGDPYLQGSLVSFDTRERLSSYLRAMQTVVDRHDILRTSVTWEGLREPVQVVWRKAVLPVEEVSLNPVGDLAGQFYEQYNPRRLRLDLRKAPWARIYIAHDPQKERWLMLLMTHHLLGDHSTVAVMEQEVELLLSGRASQLPKPVPFRNLVAQARLGMSQEEHERFFRQMLADLEEPTLAFGLREIQGNGSGLEDARMMVDKGIALRIRERARKLGLSAATLCHVAWARVLAKTSGQQDVVFGTVLFGRLGGEQGSERGVGLFMNMLPVRIQANGGAEACARRTHRLLAELLLHEHATLKLAQRCSGVRSPAPLFSAWLNYRHSRRSEEWWAGGSRAWQGIEMLRGEERTNYPFGLSIDDFGEDLGLTAQTVVTVDPERVCAYLSRALESLVEALEKSPDRAVHTLDVLPEQERLQLLYEWNTTTAEFVSEKCIHELFEEQVEKTPDATAVVFGGACLTYAGLNCRANQLARYLRVLDVKSGDLVGICVERSLEMVIGILGVLKAGAAYVPFDPAYPVERLRFMLQDSRPAVLLTLSHLRGLLNGMEAVPIVELSDTGAWQQQSETNLVSSLGGHTIERLIYVIYTSGSTGKPKGVAMPMTAAVNLVRWQIRQSNFAIPQRTLQFAALGFDVSFQEIFSTLGSGGTLVLIPEEKRRDPVEMARFVLDNRIQRLFLPYVGLQMLAEGFSDMGNVVEDRKHFHPHLQEIIVAGEQLRIDHKIEQLFRQLGHCCLENQYGPTETHVVSSYRLSMGKECWPELPPIGRPITNAQIYILDEYADPVPVGVAGEMYIGGLALARGYLNRPELTAERFVPNPFSNDAGERMYKTADLGRWREDGTVQFLGRSDFQVKIRGCRIEPGEIEARLAEHSGIQDVLVLAREDALGDRRLVAYYTVANDSSDEVKVERLQSYLARKLPEYMVPAAFVRLEKFPLSANGKLDRKALPAPEWGAGSLRSYEPPVGAIESQLVGLWAEVLHVQKVGRHDNFFELGGHSLLAMRLRSTIHSRLNYDFSLNDIFQNPTVARMALLINPTDRNAKPLVLSQPQVQSSQPPFFCIHPVGPVFCYRELAQELGAVLPLYGLQTPTDSCETIETVEQIAALQNREIRRMQPQGPYFLGGWSMGGLIAFEIARQLRAEGEAIALLTLFDTLPPSSRNEVNVENPSTLLGAFGFDMAQTIGKDISGWQARFQRLSLEEQKTLVLAELVRAGMVPRKNAEDEFNRLLSVYKRSMRAMLHYCPPPQELSIVLFKAAQSDNPDVIAREWNKWSLGGVQLRMLSGNHYTILRQPLVAQLASALKNQINKVQSVASR